MDVLFSALETGKRTEGEVYRKEKITNSRVSCETALYLLWNYWSHQHDGSPRDRFGCDLESCMWKIYVVTARSVSPEGGSGVLGGVSSKLSGRVLDRSLVRREMLI